MTDLDPTALADVHNHLVPGVDDGARSLDDVLVSVETMTRAGIRKIVTTPHIDGGLTREPARLEARLAEVGEAFARAAGALGDAFPEVDFRPGFEVMLDVPDPVLGDPRLRLAGSSFVLVEWPRLHLPPGTTQVLRRIRDGGYHPIVAHPERYVGWDPALLLAREWRERGGAYLQLNYGSLAGRYGGVARATALRFLRRGWADYLASDFHGRPDRPLYRNEAWSCLREAGGEEALQHLCVLNPARILRDEEPLPVPMLPVERGLWAKVKQLLAGDEE